MAGRAEMIRITCSAPFSNNREEQQRSRNVPNGVPALFPVLDPLDEQNDVRIAEPAFGDVERNAVLFPVRLVFGSADRFRRRAPGRDLTDL